jgi:hypothetical protein
MPNIHVTFEVDKLSDGGFLAGLLLYPCCLLAELLQPSARKQQQNSKEIRMNQQGNTRGIRINDRSSPAGVSLIRPH